MPVGQSIFGLNHLTFWAREVEVWGNRMTATSLDRLVNLHLFALGLRGQEEKRFLERHIRRGMHALDIGANQGIYTLLISRLAGADGCVHAFEPDVSLFASLRKNCERSQTANIELHNVALGSAPGVMRLYRSQVNSGDNRLSRSRHPGWFDETEVPVLALDSILDGKQVDFIKIDVQGWEYQVFLGMEKLLQENPHVRIYLEYWPLGLENAGCAPVECLRHLTRHGFSVYRVAGAGLEPLSDFEALTRSLRGQRGTNLLAVRGGLDALQVEVRGIGRAQVK